MRHFCKFSIYITHAAFMQCLLIGNAKDLALSSVLTVSIFRQSDLVLRRVAQQPGSAALGAGRTEMTSTAFIANTCTSNENGIIHFDPIPRGVLELRVHHQLRRLSDGQEE